MTDPLARLPRMECPRCQRKVAVRRVRWIKDPKGGFIPALSVPWNHNNQLGEPCKPRGT